MSADLNLSAMKVTLSFAHDDAVRARCYTDVQRVLELEDLGRQLDKARILYALIMRQVRGGPALTIVKGGEQ